MSSAYVIADVKVADPEQYKAYTSLTPAAVSAAGGEFVVRGGRHETLEGDWQPSRMVIIRFNSFDEARGFYDSAMYKEARAKRAGATVHFNMIVVEGV